MKLAQYIIILLVISVTLASEISNDVPRDNGLKLTDVVPMIFSDPEFQAMNSHEQYKLLEAIYTIVLAHVTNRKQRILLQR